MGQNLCFLHALLLFCLTFVSDKSYIRVLIIKAQEFVNNELDVVEFELARILSKNCYNSLILS